MSKRNKHKKKLKKLHHNSDSNILINVLVPDDEDLRIKCKEYLGCYSSKYRGSISVIVLGEVTKKICAIRDDALRNETFELLGQLLKNQKIEILQIDERDIKKSMEFKEKDYAIHMPELLSLARAIRAKADVFMTCDRALHNSRIKDHVRKEHGIIIKLK